MIGPASTVITALERTWAELRDRHPEVPEVVFISGKGSKALEVKWGHWNPVRWRAYGNLNGEPIPEVFISGECLAQGPRQVLQTMVHEAAHGLAYVRDIKDTSRENRYHNQKFAELAEELGLVRPETTDVVRGWSHCTLPEGAEDGWESYTALSEAIVVCIGGRLETGPATKAPTERKAQPKYECGCEGRMIRMAAKVYDEGPILCGICEEPFLEKVTA